MKIGIFSCATLLAVSAPVSSSEECGHNWVKHNEVNAIVPEPPKSISEKAADFFNPSFFWSDGCHSFPAVDEIGRTGSGLNPTGAVDGSCKRSEMGNQTYSRSGWYREKWALAYAIYEPKDSSGSGFGTRHQWIYFVIWINNPEHLENGIEAVSTWGPEGLEKTLKPREDVMAGEGIKLDYNLMGGNGHFVKLTTLGGCEPQTLISWTQLPDAARCALNRARWNGGKVMPLSDDVFVKNLADAWPFED
uniref:Uncharacterized protein n=1 Tax=Peronospora matthiolae TaxID=2874970 RepID=A0AAV1UJ08_9STRA